jgi:hypothetical protein
MINIFPIHLKKAALFILFASLTLILANPVFCQNVSVSATVNKNYLSLDDILQLSITIKGTQNTPPPKLPSLPDFRVVSAGTSSSTQYINTQRSVFITHNFKLTPMNTGTFIIGPVRVRTNGKTYSTQPISVEVQKPSSLETTGNKTAFIETLLSNKKPYIGEQLVYTFRLFHRVDAKNLNLQLPFDKTWFYKEELGEPKSFLQVINGMQYHVQELSMALFPLKIGQHKIPSTVIDLDLLHQTQSHSRRDPFSQFFNDPFWSRGTRSVHKILRSKPLSVEILPLPDGAPNGFGNLIGQFYISAKLGKNKLEVGDTTTLTVTVSGKGNVRNITLNEPTLTNSFKIYPDKPEFKQTVQNNQLTGKKTFKFALVPLTEGSRIVPKFALAYFDPTQSQYRVAETQAIALHVRPSAEKEELNLVQPGKPIVPSAKPKIQILGKDILPLYIELDKFQNDGINSFSPAFLGAGFGTPVIFFILSALLIKRKNRLKYDAAFYRRRNAYKISTQRLKQLSLHSKNIDPKEFGRALSEIIREHIGDKLNLQGKAITAGEVELRLKKSGNNIAKTTRQLLDRCEALQFAPLAFDRTKELLDETENLIKLLEKPA